MQVQYRPFGTYRFALASVVMLGHGAWLADGWLVADSLARSRAASAAVLAFFVLSGFILSEAADRFYQGRVAAFGANRFLKIVPPFLAALVFSILVHGLLTHFGLFHKAISFEGIRPELENVWSMRNLLWNPFSVVPFMRPEDVSGIHVTGPYLFVRYIWAINVEVMFYISVGFFVAMPFLRRPTAAVLLAVGLAAISFWIDRDWMIWQYVRCAPFFVLGVAIYCITKYGATSAYVTLLVVSGVTTLINGHIFVESLAGTVILCLFIGTVVLLRNARLPYSSVVDRRLGDLSYAIYLNHFVVLLVYSALGVDGIFAWISAFLCTLVLSAALQSAIELPLVGFRAKIRGQRLHAAHEKHDAR